MVVDVYLLTLLPLAVREVEGRLKMDAIS